MDHVYGDIMKEMDFCERLCCFVIFNFYPYVSPSKVVVEMFASFCMNNKKAYNIPVFVWVCSE